MKVTGSSLLPGRDMFVAGLVLVNALVAGAQNILLPTAHHHLGPIPLHQETSHQFLFRNDTQTDWHVAAARPSCDCVQIVWFTTNVPPQTEGRLWVIAKPEKPGPVDWSITLEIIGAPSMRLFGLSAWGDDGTGGGLPVEWLISPKQLLASPLPADLTFVDVRHPDKFRLAHLPDAFNLPLHTVKTRTFLRTRHLVLLNEGHDNLVLAAEAQRLHQTGFARVQILDGGFRAWQQAGGPLTGDQVQSTALSQIAPAQYHFARGQPGWVTVELGVNSDPNPVATTRPEPIPWASQHLVFNPQSFARDLTVLVQAQPQAKRCLLVCPEGMDPDRVEAALGEFRAWPVFHLAGGTRAYDEFVAQQLAMQNRRQVVLAGSTTAKPGFTAGTAPRSGGCCGRH